MIFVYDIMNNLQKKYNFDKLTFKLSSQEPFCVIASLKPEQIETYSKIAPKLTVLINQAENDVRGKLNLRCQDIPKTKYVYQGKELKISGDPNVIEILLNKIFSKN